MGGTRRPTRLYDHSSGCCCWSASGRVASKCSRVRTTIATYASGAAANTAPSARSSCRVLSVTKTRFEHSDGVARQGPDTRQCRRTVRRTVCREVFLAESAQGLITQYEVLKGNPSDEIQPTTS